MAGGKSEQVEKAKGQARAAGIERCRHLRRRAAVDRDSGVPAGVRRAGVAAIARDQHAAEDLSVSAIGKADRRDATADPYAGLERRHRDSDRRRRPKRSARGLWRRCRTRRGRRWSGRGRANWPRRNTATRPISSGRNRRARRSSRTFEPTAESPAAARCAEGRRVSGPPSRDHYSYSVYADPATARSFDRAALRRSNRTDGRRRRRRTRSRASPSPIRDRTILDVGTGTGRAAILHGACGGRVSPPSIRRRKCSPSRGERAADGIALDSVRRSATRTGSNSPIGRSTSSSACAC